jgi:hypothetical protein
MSTERAVIKDPSTEQKAEIEPYFFRGGIERGNRVKNRDTH